MVKRTSSGAKLQQLVRGLRVQAGTPPAAMTNSHQPAVLTTNLHTPLLTAQPSVQGCCWHKRRPAGGWHPLAPNRQHHAASPAALPVHHRQTQYSRVMEALTQITQHAAACYSCVALHPIVQLKPLHKPESSGQAATHLQVWYGLWLRLATARCCCRRCCQLAGKLLLQLCMVPHQVAEAKQCLHKLQHTTHPKQRGRNCRQSHHTW